MINTKKAFTLVELIVVITILAILGTIAFISLQGYSADARNSKRTEDLKNLAGSVNIKTTKGTSLISFVVGTSAKITGISIAGKAPAIDKYSAGTPNYTALGVKGSDFRDPVNSTEYKIGSIIDNDGKFEFAASMEESAGSNSAKIVGTFTPRVGITGTPISGSGTTAIKISSSDINKFYRGDTITIWWGSNSGTITSISTDWSQLNLSFTASNTWAITLSVNESAGLIRSLTNASSGVINKGSLLPY